MMQWLEIQPEDDEKTVNKKKKLQKAHKSKMRFAKLDKETKERQSSWQNFQKGTVKKKKKPAGMPLAPVITAVLAFCPSLLARFATNQL